MSKIDFVRVMPEYESSGLWNKIDKTPKKPLVGNGWVASEDNNA